MKSLPPLHDVAEMAGIDLPQYLGRTADIPEAVPVTDHPKAPKGPKGGNA